MNARPEQRLERLERQMTADVHQQIGAIGNLDQLRYADTRAGLRAGTHGAPVLLGDREPTCPRVRTSR